MLLPRTGVTGSDFDPDGPSAPCSGIFGLSCSPSDAAVVLLPVPFEATVSYRRGTAAAPSAILRASHQVDLYDIELGHPYRQGIAWIREPREFSLWNRQALHLAIPVHEAGGSSKKCPHLSRASAQVDAIAQRLHNLVEKIAHKWIEKGKLLGLIGGEHSVSFGAIRAHARKWPGLGILQIDAHADLRNAYEGFFWSHASVMKNVLDKVDGVHKLVQVAVRDLGPGEAAVISSQPKRIATHFDTLLAAERFQGMTWAEQCSRIVDDLPSRVYVSVDIDGLKPSCCPSTGTPVPGGLGFRELNYLLGRVAKTGRQIVGFDLVEVAMGSHGVEWDAIVGARVLYRLIAWALESRKHANS